MSNIKHAWIYAVILGVVVPALFLKIMPYMIEPKQFQTEEKVDEQIGVLCDDGLVKYMDLEEYVIGVVSAEMPAEFDVEALKAQAVIARTYCLKRRSVSDKHEYGVVCMQSSCCQAFCTDDVIATNDVFRTAVEDTKGMVLVYNNALIEATYFSCSGGYTEDASAVWGTDIPYLQAQASPGEENSRHFVSTIQFSKKDFAEVLDIDFDNGEIGEPVYTDGGGIKEVTIGGKSFSGVKLRQLLGLKSTAIFMSVVGDQVIITTKGYGHRVGMSQYGAEAMAVGGSGFEEILAYYYPGAQLVSYNSLTKSW